MHIIQHPENENKVAVFDTYEEAEAAQAYCYVNHIANHPDPAYVATTTRWAEPRQRVDGKWDIPVCHHTDATGATNLEDYNPENYPSGEEV
jgi:hypothetical protein